MRCLKTDVMTARAVLKLFEPKKREHKPSQSVGYSVVLQFASTNFTLQTAERQAWATKREVVQPRAWHKACQEYVQVGRQTPCVEANTRDPNTVPGPRQNDG